jgi:lambda family phage tail tape measure protein
VARSENRQLSITAKLIDLMTKPLGQMQGKFLAFGKAIIDRSKGILSSVFNLRNAVIGLATSFLSLSSIKSFGEQADALLKLSASTGDTVENLSELQASFELAGVGAEDFGGVLKALETQARKARTDGTDKLQNAFADLGISIEDLRTLGPSQLFEKMAAGLEKYSTAQEKTVALGKVLPKQFLDLLPVLGNGLRKFQDGIRDARDSGATVTQQQAEVAERLNDSLTKIQISLGNVARSLIEQFGPQAIAIFERLAKGITSNRDGIIAIAKAVGEGLVKAFGLASEAVIGLIAAVEKIPGVDLIDEKATRSRIAAIKSDLRDLSEARSGTSTARTNEILSILGDPDQVREIGQARVRRLRAELEELQDEIVNARNKRWVERLAATEQDKRAELADLEVTLDQGLAGAIRKSRDKLAAQLDQAAASVRNAGITEAPAAEPQSTPSVFNTKNVQRDLENVGNAAKDAGEKARVAFGGDFWEGFSDGTKNAIAEITDFGRAGQAAANQILTGGFNGLSDAFADALTGTKKLKDALKDFARSFVQDLARIITRLIIVRSLSSIFNPGGGTGGIALEKGGVVQGNMGTPVRAFAAGGVTNGPTLALFGEGRNREAFVPLPDNRTIPVTLTGGGGGDTHVHFNVSAIDARSVQQMLLEQGPTIAAVVAERAGSRTKFRQDLSKAVR